jgi:hypothetical protein
MSGGINIEAAYELAGVHYWAQYYEHLSPALEIFEYIGIHRTGNTEYNVFRSRSNGTLTFRTLAQMQSDPNFRPFLLNIPKIEEFLEQYDEFDPGDDPDRKD